MSETGNLAIGMVRVMYQVNRRDGDGWTVLGTGYCRDRLCANGEWRPEAGPFASYAQAEAGDPPSGEQGGAAFAGVRGP